MTSGRSELRLLRPDDGRFASWCGSCAKARRSLGIGKGETQMRKISLLAAISLMLAGVGVWATSNTQARIQARIHVPTGAQINSLQINMGARDLPNSFQIMVRSRDLPVAHYDDYSLVFN